MTFTVCIFVQFDSIIALFKKRESIKKLSIVIYGIQEGLQFLSPSN